jgi:hypothetical protein
MTTIINLSDITPPPMVEKKEEEEEVDTGFGTEYHDGSGFDDCDSENTGWRTCKEIADKSKWCSECVYLNNGEGRKVEEDE